jgi:hypothetical protein
MSPWNQKSHDSGEVNEMFPHWFGPETILPQDHQGLVKHQQAILLFLR